MTRTTQNRILFVAALLAALTYVLSGFLNLGQHLWLAIPFFVFEGFAAIQLGLLMTQTWTRPQSGESPLARVPRDVELPATMPIVVTCTFHSPDELERTLAGCRSVHNRGEVIVVLRPDSQDLLDVANRFPFSIAEVAGNHTDAFWAAAEGLDAPFVAWLEAGQIPFPNFIDAAIGEFSDPSTAIVQSRVGLIATGSFGHLRSGRDEDAFLDRIVYPSMGGRGEGPWFGGGSLVRTKAIEISGGLDAGDQAALSRALVRLHSQKWATKFGDETTVRAAAPNTIGEYLMGRRRKAIESLRVFRTPDNPLRLKGLSARQRITHLALASPFFTSLRHLALAVILATALTTGATPFGYGAGTWLMLWGSANVLGAIARHRVAMGTMRAGDWVRQSWRTLTADISGVLTVLGRTGKGARLFALDGEGKRAFIALRPVTALMALLDVALLLRGLTLIWPKLLPRFTTFERVTVFALSLLVLASMVDVLQLAVTRRQRRKTVRLQTDLGGNIEGIGATVVDLSPNGLGAKVTQDADLEVGDTCSFGVVVVMGGEATTLTGSAVVRSVVPLETETRIGLEFTNPDPELRASLAEYCAVHLDQEESVLDLTALDVPNKHPRLARAMAGTAMFVGAITLFLGPTAPSALADVGISSTVCLQTSSGDPLADGVVRYHHDAAWKAGGTTDATGCVGVLLPDAPTQVDITHRGVRAVKTQDPTVDPNIVFATTPITVTLSDSTGNPLKGATVQHNAGGLKDFGTTDSSGAAVSELLPFAKLGFNLTYDGRVEAKILDFTLSTEISFSTVATEFVLRDSAGAPLQGAVVQYHSGAWKPFGTTDENGIARNEIMTGAVPFTVTYEGRSIRVDQNTGNNPRVEHSTVPAEVRFTNSAGDPLENAEVFYSAAGLQRFGTTDASGVARREVLIGSISYLLKYNGQEQSFIQDLYDKLERQVSTIETEVSFENSKGSPIPGANVTYYALGWKTFGTTGADGIARREILGGKVPFTLSHDGQSTRIDQDIIDNPRVQFETVEAEVSLSGSDGEPLEDASVTYYALGWKTFGTTGADGIARKEILGGRVPFTLRYDGQSTRIDQDIIDNPRVQFETVEAEVSLVDSKGEPIPGASVIYYALGWKDFGRTGADGIARKEILSGKIPFTIKHANQESRIDQDIADNPRVEFETVEAEVSLVDSKGEPIPGASVIYYALGWRDFGRTGADGIARRELLGATIPFTVKYQSQQARIDQDIRDETRVEFQTIEAAVSLSDPDGDPVPNARVTYYVLGWRDFGRTGADGIARRELLGATIPFTTTYEGTSSRIDQDIQTDPIVEFTTTVQAPATTETTVAPTTSTIVETTVPPTTAAPESTTTTSVDGSSPPPDTAPPSSTVPPLATLPPTTVPPAPAPQSGPAPTLSTPTESAIDDTSGSTTPEVNQPLPTESQTSSTNAPILPEDVTELDPTALSVSLAWSPSDSTTDDELELTLDEAEVVRTEGELSTVVYGISVENTSEDVIPSGTVVEIDMDGALNLVPLRQDGWSCNAADERWLCTSTADIDAGASSGISLGALVNSSGTPAESVSSETDDATSDVLAFKESNNRGDYLLVLIALVLFAGSIPAGSWIVRSIRRSRKD